MLLRNLDFLTHDPVEFARFLVMVAIALTVAITVHEFSHGLAAYRLGDDTAKRAGRLSLNPLVHLDPLGTALLLLAGFGWGKAVPVNPQYLKQPAKWSLAMVSVSGAAANLVTAAVAGLGIRLGGPVVPEGLGELLKYVVLFNIILAVFNLVPIPPLDGSKIASALLPDRARGFLAPAARFAPFLLLGVIAIDSFSGTGFLWRIIGWPISRLAGVFMGFNPL